VKRAASPRENGLIEKVVERGNMNRAWKRVKANHGGPGPDGKTVEETEAWLKLNGRGLAEAIRTGRYQPQAVKRVAIPKPGGGTRELGIPNAVDRLVQQALLQVLQPLWDPTFHPSSFGFRPGRNAHQALESARRHVKGGKRWVVDADLEKFFDRVDHAVLMRRVSRRVGDRKVLQLIRRYLKAGAMVEMDELRNAADTRYDTRWYGGAVVKWELGRLFGLYGEATLTDSTAGASTAGGTLGVGATLAVSNNFTWDFEESKVLGSGRNAWTESLRFSWRL